jgi:hypothetical protein
MTEENEIISCFIKSYSSAVKADEIPLYDCDELEFTAGKPHFTKKRFF